MKIAKKHRTNNCKHCFFGNVLSDNNSSSNRLLLHYYYCYRSRTYSCCLLMRVLDEPEFMLSGSQVVYGWRHESRQSRHNLTCIVDARPEPRLYWTRHHHHHQQQQQLQSNETFRVVQLNSTVTVLQVRHRTYVRTYCRYVFITSLTSTDDLSLCLRSSSVAALHHGVEDSPPSLRPTYCFASVIHSE